jgi:hypothetical protein
MRPNVAERSAEVLLVTKEDTRAGRSRLGLSIRSVGIAGRTSPSTKESTQGRKRESLSFAQQIVTTVISGN